MQNGGCDWGICAKDTKQGGHVRVDHACSLGHSGEAVLPVWGRGEGECRREELGEGVCCADSTSGSEPGIMGGGKSGISRWDFVQDLGDGEPVSFSYCR